tara:strand:- start:4609 stop:5247 length:639 start_codon:yes stop_codon:yes gene_type:complete
MKLDSKQFVPFVLVIAFLGLVAIVFFSFNFNSRQLETFKSILQEETDLFLVEYVSVLQNGFLDQETDSLQLVSLSDQSIILLFAARWSDKSSEVVNQIEQIINRFNSTTTDYYEKAPKLVIALVLDTREGYGKQVERIQLKGDNKGWYGNDHDFSKQHLIIDGSNLFNEFQIPGIPTLVYLMDGQILWTQVGYRNASQLQPLTSLIKTRLGS